MPEADGDMQSSSASEGWTVKGHSAPATTSKQAYKQATKLSQKAAGKSTAKKTAPNKPKIRNYNIKDHSKG